ncbi:ABC transporter permease [Edaphobacillus lindanitolerans]|uniref:Peptide/nickel transport system permease protein n=1 Tax=Edaphobacillus lindanitolerans TaxID=550447 RepID=A0A1U7PK34_9BACI|nr:ABC transporter permease [Edaphobacillus lindanitolerans]SIT72037.1 peptide/nickel transport system permease protein [Edaphobacillus lindanitolerans]
MLDFVIKRVIQVGIVVLLALTVVFFLIRLSGDPTPLFLPPDAPREQIDEYRSKLGFDRPLLVQYGEFMKNAVQGDFGNSLRSKEDALGMVLQRLPATFQLAISALVLSLLISIPLGVLSAFKRNSIFDRIAVALTVIGQAIPSFWFGLLLIFIFAAQLKVLPSGGGGSIVHMILPTLTLAAYSIARFTRFTRSTMLDVLRKDFIRTAKASGVPTPRLIARYALKNSLIPIITLVALDLGTLLGGAVITEVVFSWPGIGRLLLQSLLNRDFPIVLAGVFIIALIYAVINFVADLLYAFVNPQIRVR